MRRNKVAVSIEALGTVDLSRSRAEAYEAVRQYPAQTALELEEITGTRLIQRRLSELEELGLLVCGEPRVCVVSGRRAHTYSVNPNPRAPGDRPRRETVADVRRSLSSCKEEVRYLAGRLAQVAAERDALVTQLEDLRRALHRYALERGECQVPAWKETARGN